MLSAALLLCKASCKQPCWYNYCNFGLCRSYSPTVTQHRVTTTILGTLCMLSAALLLCKASCKQPCWSHLLHLWVLQFIQPYSESTQSHSNHAWDPVHALCSTAALQSKLQKALLVTTSTPMGFCSLYSPTVTQHRVKATILGTLCILSAALLLFKASCKQPCWSQLLHLWALQVIQPYSDPTQSHSNHPWDPVHDLCSTAALQSKLQTALLVTTIAPLGFAGHTALQ